MLRNIASVGLALVGALVACSADDGAAPNNSGGKSSSSGSVPNPNGKAGGAECKADADCQSLKCTAGKCAAVAKSDTTNGKKDGDETDTDCGGSAAPCPDGKACKVAEDCENKACAGGQCKAPAPDDGAKNGDETDVDCGGTKAPKCAADKGCKVNEDCTSDACTYNGKCVQFKSCTGQFGGDTCGAGETGAAGAKHESCCTTVQGQNGPIGKYHITAGRMRTFITRFNGDLKSWAATNPPGWNAQWNDQLPASMDDVSELMGPDGKRGCNIGNGGGRTYWQDKDFGNGDKNDLSKNQLDEKVLNCVTWHMAHALCVFDGGRLASTAELVDIMTNGGSTQMPWGGAGYNEKQQDDHLNHRFNYETPNPPAALRKQADGTPVDRAWFVSPPGRFPTGASTKSGAMDATGDVLAWVNDQPLRFLFTISWEEHPKKTTSDAWNGSDGSNAYYALGARCSFAK